MLTKTTERKQYVFSLLYNHVNNPSSTFTTKMDNEIKRLSVKIKGYLGPGFETIRLRPIHWANGQEVLIGHIVINGAVMSDRGAKQTEKASGNAINCP